MKQRKHFLNQVSVRLLAYFIGAVLITAACSFYYVSSPESSSSGDISGYGIECSTSVPAILPGMMNGFISVESCY